MLAVSLVLGSFLTVLFLIVGLIGGWVAREYMMNYREVPRPHPEMFDCQGNLIPDEVIAFRFDSDFGYDERGIIRFNSPEELINIINNLTPNDYYERLPYINYNYELAKIDTIENNTIQFFDQFINLNNI